MNRKLFNFHKKGWFRVVTTLILVILLLNTNSLPVSAGCGIDGWDIAGAIATGGISLIGNAAGCAANEAEEIIEVAGREAEEVVAVAGSEARAVVRVAGNEAEQVTQTIGAEAQEVLIVGSNEAQNIIRVAGSETEQVIHAAGSEGRALLNEAEEIIVVASQEAQMVAHVTGQEARATAAMIGAESREVILIASNESQKVVHLAGEEARLVVRTAGEEARATLQQFHEQNERMLELISETYQDNLDITIDSLDEGSRRAMRNFESALFAVNQAMAQDLLLIESSTIRTIKEANGEIEKSIVQLEASTEGAIIIAGETTVYLVDRITNNTITVISIVLLGIGFLLLIYLFFVHQLPSGTAARFVYSFILIYLLGCGTLLLSPTARAYSMRSIQIGLRAELQKSTYPEIVSVDIVTEAQENGQPRIEIFGLHLRTVDNIPTATFNNATVSISALSEERLAIPLDEEMVAAMKEQSVELVLDYGEPGLIFPITLRLPDPLSVRLGQARAIPTPVRDVQLQLTSSESAPVFAGPDNNNYSYIGELETEAQYIVVGRNGEQTWWEILWVDGSKHWVSATFVEIIGNPINVPVTYSSASTVTPSPTPTRIASATPNPTQTPLPAVTPQPSPTPVPQVTAKGLPVNVRLGDGISYNAFGHGLPAGETALLLATNRSRSWGKIETGNGIGWISLDNSIVSVVGNLDSLPIENPLPILANDEISMNEDTSAQIAVLSNDQGNFNVSSLKVVHIDRGQATVSGNKVVYVPPTNFFGNTTVDYEICDESTCSRATIFISVQPVNDAPSFILQRSQLSGQYYPGLITVEKYFFRSK